MKITPARMGAIAAGAGVAAAGLWVCHDYRKWLALGPGGLPYNFRGWMTTTWMRLRKCDPLDASCFVASPGEVACLSQLPLRVGTRPLVGVHPVPHRQLNQLPDEAMKRDIETLFDACVERHSSVVKYQLSHFEKRHPAVTLRETNHGSVDARASRGEIAHTHPSDGSMHMIFSRGDARAVIENGWGERHPLAGVMLDLPETYLLIYPPREETELKVTAQLLEAAVVHMTSSGLEVGKGRE